MGRILFLSAVAFVAYRYISKSNLRHQALGSGQDKLGDNNGVELLPPAPAAPSPVRGSASESAPTPQLVGASPSRAAESDPVR